MDTRQRYVCTIKAAVNRVLQSFAVLSHRQYRGQGGKPLHLQRVGDGLALPNTNAAFRVKRACNNK